MINKQGEKINYMVMEERKQKFLALKKNEIIDGMERALLLKSYENLTIDDVAKAAEYSKKTIYSYFNSKDEIYLELIVRKFNVLNETLEKAVNISGKTGIEKIKVIGKAYYKFANESPEYMQSIINYETNGNFENLEISKMLELFNQDLEKSFLLLVNAIKEGILEGSIAKDTDALKAAILLWSSINGFILLELKKGQHLKSNYGIVPDEMLDYTLEMMMRVLQIEVISK